MNDSLISLFIDDEMDLDEKVEFVETVHSSQVFTQETVDLLEQEKLLHVGLGLLCGTFDLCLCPLCFPLF